MKEPLHNKSFHFFNPKIGNREGDKIQIALIGAGATGSQMAYNLAAMSIIAQQLEARQIKLVVIDPDKVEPHNVGKQSFHTPDVGENKAIALVTRLNRAYGLNWEAVPKKYNPKKPYLRGIGMAISCVDNWKTRVMIGEKLHNEFLYWMDIGNSKDTGQIHLMARDDDRLPGVIKQAENAPPAIEEENVSCSMIESLQKQSMFINKFMATAAAALLSDLFYKGYVKYSGAYVNLELMRLMPILL